MEEEIVTLRAVVVRREDAVVTVRLVDGFGRAECVVHADALTTQTDPQETTKGGK